MFQRIKEQINVEDFKDEYNKEIISKIYEKCNDNDININLILNDFSEEIQNKLTEIMTNDYGITDYNKAFEDILIKYQREKLERQRDEILVKIENETDKEEKYKLGQELNNIIMKLVKIK